MRSANYILVQLGEKIWRESHTTAYPLSMYTSFIRRRVTPNTMPKTPSSKIPFVKAEQETFEAWGWLENGVRTHLVFL